MPKYGQNSSHDNEKIDVHEGMCIPGRVTSWAFFRYNEVPEKSGCLRKEIVKVAGTKALLGIL